MLCARLSFPGRLSQLADIFGRSPSWLSTVFNEAVLYLYNRFLGMLYWHPLLTYDRMRVFAAAVEEVGGAEDIWGFVDGTFRGYSRPQGQEDQQLVFSGHKRLHGQKYQAIVTPDGLVSSLTGPWPGPVNDWSMWRRSGCPERLREVIQGHKILYLYGDPAYRSSYGVACPWTDPRGRRFLPADKQAWNRALSSVRISVEQGFGRTQCLWTYTAYAKGLRAGSSLVGAYFFVAVLLTNCHTCLRGISAAGSRFLVPPPLVEAYLSI